MNSRFIITFIVFLFLVNCKSPEEKITEIILYQDSIGYWNYEWPRERATFMDLRSSL